MPRTPAAVSPLRPVRTLAVVAAGCLLAACPGPGPQDAGTDAGELIPTTNAEHNQMLEALGFDTNLGPRKDPAGAAVPDGYHPLKTRYSVFHPRAELYLAGFTADTRREHLFDDASKAYARMAFTGKQDDSWATANLKNGVAGDFDGDGVEELFVAYYVDATRRLRFLVIDVDGAAVKEGELDPDVPSTNLDGLLQPSLAAGDLDGDGRDEVAVGFSRFYLVDTLENDPTITVKALAGQDLNDVFVAMGNTDWDGADELVVTYTTGNQTIGRYALYDGTLNAPTQEGPLTFIVGGAQHVGRDAQVAIGDVDGDRLGEIVFGGLIDGSRWALYALEYNRPTDSPLYGWKSLLFDPNWVNGAIPRPLLLLDWDGDAKKEIFFNLYIYDVTRELAPTQVAIGFGDTLHRVAAGDVDGDGRDDLIYEWGTIEAYGLNSLDVPAHKRSWSGTLTPYSSVIMVPLNVDRDSAMVRYDGEHELLLTAPQIVAVLASPPYHDGLGQNVDATSSTFGKIVEQTVEKETSLGVTTGFSVGYEADFAFFGGAEFNMSVEQSLDFIAGESASIERSHSYTTGPGEDKVVFTTVPFDVYYYVIVSSPDAKDVGRTVSINVPREPQTLATTLAFYNAHNGGGLDVDSRILRHTPGDVWSYPTLAERDVLLAAADEAEPGYDPLWNGPIAVGEGGGYDTVGISKTQGSKRGASMDFSVEFSFESKSPGGAKAGASVGFHYGYSATFSTSDTAFFEGSVGNLPAAAFTAENRYQFGLFVYPYTTGGQKFLVMNWWTER